MGEYKTRPVYIPEYTQERKQTSFSPLYRVSLHEKEMDAPYSDVLEYTDKATAIYATDANPLGKTLINESSVYSLEKQIVYLGKRPVVKITIKENIVEYVPGDSILLWASNSESVCSALMSALCVPNKRWISFTRTHIRTGQVAFSFTGMASDYFRHFMDVTTLPSKMFLHRISEYAEPSEKDKLQYLSSKEGSKDYFGMKKNWNSIIDILVQFKVKVPMHVLLEISTEIKPRAFSLVNSQGEDSAVIVGSLSSEIDGSVRNGHFTEYVRGCLSLESRPYSQREAEKDRRVLDRGIVYRVQHKPNMLMRLQKETKSAMLFGIGTGVAPFISFVVNNKESKKFSLFYGCRSKDENILVNIGFVCEPGEESEYTGAILYRKENTEIHVVYSRENRCLRMQSFLEENKESISNNCKIFNDLYICGNKKAMEAIAGYFTENHPGMAKYIDDWT